MNSLVSSEKLEEMKALGDYIGKMLSGLINSIKNANSSKSSSSIGYDLLLCVDMSLKTLDNQKKFNYIKK